MTDVMVNPGIGSASGPSWQVASGRRVRVHALPGSYAARRAPALLREAERVVEALEKLLEPPGEARGQPVDVFLTDPPLDGSDAPPATVRGDAIVQVVQPESPGESLVGPLVRLLATRWLGEQAGEAGLFLDGLAGVVAGRLGRGPSVQEATARVRADLAAGRPPALLRQVAAPPSGAAPSAPTPDPAATAFVGFLIEQFGARALRQFLASYDPARRDQAATTAYQRPLGALLEGWLAGLRRPPSGTTAFRTFLGHVTPLLRPYAWREGEVLLYMLFGLSYSVAIPLASKYLVDTVLPSGSVRNLALFIVALLAYYVLDALIGMRRAYVTNWINQRVLFGLQQRMFDHLQRLSHNFYTTAKVGDIMSRLFNDLQVVQQAMAQVLGTGLYLALRAVAAAVAMLALSPLLGALVLVVVPLFIASYLALRTRIAQSSYERQRLTGEVTSATQENLSAYGVIRAYGLEGSASRAYASRLEALLAVILRLTVIGSLFEASTALAVTLGQLVVLGVGGYLVIQGNLTIGTLLAFIGILPSLFQPVAALANVGQVVQMASGSMTRITELLDEPVAIADRPGAVAVGPLTEAIRFEDVTFSYDGERPILSDLDLTLPAGQHVAIVGPSGSGKSTVVSLILRFWDPDQGRIRWDGRDLRDVTLASLRGQVGIVFQDTFLFDTTVRENIAIGRPGASDEQVVAAARAARLDSFVASLPAGYDTVLGERGVRMSGGQRQRLAIARALLRDPALLILDEATSALDAQTEREILETLEVATRGRTTISITHRLALAAQADRIVVLAQGRVVEQGSHAELLAAGGLYRRLYEEQMGSVTEAASDEGRLQAIPLFAGLDARALAALAGRLVRERADAGEAIVREGEAGEALYLIQRGQVEVVVGSGDAERRLNLLNEGDYFGEMALLSEQPRSATVRATVPTQLFSLARADFVELLEQEPTIRQAVAEVVAARRAALSGAMEQVAG